MCHLNLSPLALQAPLLSKPPCSPSGLIGGKFYGGGWLQSAAFIGVFYWRLLLAARRRARLGARAAVELSRVGRPAAGGQRPRATPGK